MLLRLIPFLVFLAVIALGGAILVIRGWRRRLLQSRLYGEKSGSAEFGQRSFDGMATPPPRNPRLVNTVEQIGRAVSSGESEPGLREWLAQAGYYDDAAPTVYVGAQLVLGLLALMIGGAIAFSLNTAMLTRVCIIVPVLAALARLPNFLVGMRRRRRTAQVRRNLPDAVDLLEICVSSGMGLDMAWNAVSDEFRGVSA